MPRLAPLLLTAPALGAPVPQLAPTAITQTAGDVLVTLHDGRGVTRPAIRLTRPACAGGHDVGIDDLETLLKRIDAQGEPDRVITRSQRGAGLSLIWNVFGDSSPEAEAGLQATSDFYAQRFHNNVSVTINVTFDPNGFGSTSPTLIEADYEDVRLALLAGADADDTIQTLLPPGSLPVRRFFGGAVLQQTDMIISSANARALGFAIDPGVIDAVMVIGSELDFNPADGLDSPGNLGDHSGVDLLIHEVGHALGFMNLTDLGMTEINTLDFYRFAETGPSNPGNIAEFTAFPRALYMGSADPDQQHQLDLIDTETQLSNAFPFQASHFRETNFTDYDAPRLGVMEPALAALETRHPTYMSQADLDAFDAIGWDLVNACSPADLAPPVGVLNFDDVLAFLTAFGAMDTAADLAPPMGVLNFDDVLAFLAAFGAGCP